MAIASRDQTRQIGHDSGAGGSPPGCRPSVWATGSRSPGTVENGRRHLVALWQGVAAHRRRPARSPLPGLSIPGRVAAASGAQPSQWLQALPLQPPTKLAWKALRGAGFSVRDLRFQAHFPAWTWPTPGAEAERWSDGLFTPGRSDVHGVSVVRACGSPGASRENLASGAMQALSSPGRRPQHSARRRGSLQLILALPQLAGRRLPDPVPSALQPARAGRCRAGQRRRHKVLPVGALADGGASDHHQHGRELVRRCGARCPRPRFVVQPVTRFTRPLARRARALTVHPQPKTWTRCRLVRAYRWLQHPDHRRSARGFHRGPDLARSGVVAAISRTGPGPPHASPSCHMGRTANRLKGTRGSLQAKQPAREASRLITQWSSSPPATHMDQRPATLWRSRSRTLPR